MKAFRVTGKFQMGHIKTPFTLEAIAKDDAGARDRIYAQIGSRHRANRYQIWIEKVTEIKAGDITGPVGEKQLAMGK